MTTGRIIFVRKSLNTPEAPWKANTMSNVASCFFMREFRCFCWSNIGFSIRVSVVQSYCSVVVKNMSDLKRGVKNMKRHDRKMRIPSYKSFWSDETCMVGRTAGALICLIFIRLRLGQYENHQGGWMDAFICCFEIDLSQLVKKWWDITTCFWGTLLSTELGRTNRD